MRRFTFLLLVGCTRPPASIASPTPAPSVAQTGDEEVTKLCKELYPCPPHSPDNPPFMCALDGQRIVPPLTVDGLRIESVACRFRKAGMSAIVGVPVDGSRPLVTEDALLDRVKMFPDARVRVLGGNDSLQQPECRPTERAGLLHYCAGDGAEVSRMPTRCTANERNSVACAQRNPDRFLAACQALHATERVTAAERYWGPGVCAIPSNHVRAQTLVELAKPEQTKDDPNFGDNTKLALRVNGAAVRALSCNNRDHLFVDGEAQPTTKEKLLPRLDTDAMRAVLAVDGVRIAESAWAVLLEPDGSFRAISGCTPAPGPRRQGDRIAFFMMPVPLEGSNTYRAPLQECGLTLRDWSVACRPVESARFCE